MSISLSRKSLTRQAFRGALALALAATASQSHAVRFGTPGQGVSGSFDVIAAYSNLFRVQEQDEDSRMLTVTDNNDDGNRNFGRGLVSNMVKAVVDFGVRNDVSQATSYGMFLRGYALYDFAVQGEERSNDVLHDIAGFGPFPDSSLNTNNSAVIYSGGCTAEMPNCFNSAIEERAGSNSEILDAFVYADLFQDTEHPLNIKIGKQLINWGESLFIQTGIVNAINAADVTRAAIPGTEIKEILLPAYAASFNVAINQNIGLAGFWMFEDRKTIAPPVGSYFSTVDFIGPGSENIIIGPPFAPATLEFGGTVGQDDDNEQWGLALTWYSEALGDTEFGFYYAKLNDKTPGLGFTASDQGEDEMPGYGIGVLEVGDTSYFHHEYQVGYDLYGFSFNTTLGGWGIFETSMSGEIAWRDGAGIQVQDGDDVQAAEPLLKGVNDEYGPDWAFQDANAADADALYTALGDYRSINIAGELVTVQLTFNHKILLPWLADDITMLMEVGAVHTPGMKDGVPVDEKTWDDEDYVYRSTLAADTLAMGYKTKTFFTWFEALAPIHPVFSGTDLKLTITWNQDFSGNSVITGGSFYVGQRALGLSLDATWQANLSVGLTYNTFWWDHDETQLGDRDVAGMVVKYSF